MGLRERISEDMKTAMKSGAKVELETLRMIRAQILEFEKRGEGTEMSPEQELAILTTAAKKRREAIEQYEKANRPELAEAEKLELEIIARYLPAQASDEEIQTVIARIVSETGANSAKDFGKVMPAVMKELKGKADGKRIQELVKETLSRG